MTKQFKSTIDFIDSLANPPKPDYGEIFGKLYDGVINTNALIGLTIDKLEDAGALQATIDTYEKLLQDEFDELDEALANQDKVEVVKEAIDCLIVGFMLQHLTTGVKDYGYKHWSTAPVYPADIVGAHLSVKLVSVEILLEQIGNSADILFAVDLVLAENLSKFATMDQIIDHYTVGPVYPSLDMAIDLQIQEIESQGRYSGVYHEIVVDNDGKERIILWCGAENGTPKKKYLKGCCYKKSDLSVIYK